MFQIRFGRGGRPTLRALSWLLLCLCVLAVAAPAGARVPGDTAAAADLHAYLGYYEPNTTIELRGDQLWFVRPPYESQLVSIGSGLFGFTQGYLQGTPLRFVQNADASSSIQLLSGAGAWYEFARSGVGSPISPALADRFNQVLDRAVSELHIPGVVMAVDLPGQGLWTGARGVSNRDLGIPMVPGDHFRIASISKMFVATVALQLVQEGWLQLDQTVEFWLPGMLPNGDKITVRELLNHTSGLYDYLDSTFDRYMINEPGRVWAPEELVAYAAQHRAQFAPGEAGRWSYSNTNYVLLGLIVQKVTQHPLQQEIHSRILDPLGMGNTFFEPAESVPGGPMRSYEGARDLTDINLSVAWGAGSITSTTSDLTRFAQALFGGQLLRPETLALMQDFMPARAGWAQGYGLGMMQDHVSVGNNASGQPRAAELGLVRGHTGGLIGERSVLWYFPERGITMAISINVMNADPNHVAAWAIDAILAASGE